MVVSLDSALASRTRTAVDVRCYTSNTDLTSLHSFSMTSTITIFSSSFSTSLMIDYLLLLKIACVLSMVAYPEHLLDLPLENLTTTIRKNYGRWQED